MPKPSKFLADSFMGVPPLSENLLSTVSGRTNKATVFFAQFLAPNRHQNDAQAGVSSRSGKIRSPIAEDAVAKVVGNASRLLGSAADGTELQPNTDPHIRSYSVNRSRNAEGDMISIAVGKFPAPWGGTWRRCKASRVAVPHLAVWAPDTQPLAAGCFIHFG